MDRAGRTYLGSHRLQPKGQIMDASITRLAASPTRQVLERAVTNQQATCRRSLRALHRSAVRSDQPDLD